MIYILYPDHLDLITAVDVASQAINGAHSEAEGYPNGIGLLKLMGRHSGYIAATAALARQDVICAGA